MDGWVDACMDVRMYGVDVCIYVYSCVCMCVYPDQDLTISTAADDD